MPVQCVKVNQIHKAKASEILVLSYGNTLLHTVYGGLGVLRLRDSLIVKYIRNFPDRNDTVAGIFQNI